MIPLNAPAPLDQASTAEPLDLVFIEGFVGHTVIGIHDSELHRPQPVQIDLCAGTPRSAAGQSDDIADALDYSVLRERLHRLMAEHGVRLLEALAEQVAHIVLHEFGARWVRVRVAKPNKFADVQAVGVQIERQREPKRSTATVLHLLGTGMAPPNKR